MTVNAILACDAEYGIGRNNGLPWPHDPTDMKWFGDNTKNGVVVMGRRTWESIGNTPLKNRINVVVTRSRVLNASPDMIYYGEMGKLTQYIQMNYPDKNIWFIGGADIYRQAIPYCDHLYMTKFNESYICDTHIDPALLEGFTTIAEKKTDNATYTIGKRI